MIIHKRIRVYLLVPDTDSRKDVDVNVVVADLNKKYAHLIDHPIYGIRVKQFINEDLSRLGVDPPELPDLPLGFSEALAKLHNEFVKIVYSRHYPTNEYSFLVRVPVEGEMLEQIRRMVGGFIAASKDMPENKKFEEAARLISRIIELGIVSGDEIWPKDVIDDLREIFLGMGIDPRELKDYYSFHRKSAH